MPPMRNPGSTSLRGADRRGSIEERGGLGAEAVGGLRASGAAAGPSDGERTVIGDVWSGPALVYSMANDRGDPLWGNCGSIIGSIVDATSETIISLSAVGDEITSPWEDARYGIGGRLIYP